MEFNEETLALDVVHKHALSADFLGTEHTVRHVCEGWQPRLVDRHVKLPAQFADIRNTRCISP